MPTTDFTELRKAEVSLPRLRAARRMRIIMTLVVLGTTAAVVGAAAATAEPASRLPLVALLLAVGAASEIHQMRGISRDARQRAVLEAHARAAHPAGGGA